MSKVSSIILIVPCFNEEFRLDVSKFKRIVKEFNNLRVLFINDGSTDNTGTIIHNLQNENSSFLALDLPKNVGKANAIRCGFNYVIKDLNKELKKIVSHIGYTDSDSQISVDDIGGVLKFAMQARSEKPRTSIASEWYFAVRPSQVGGSLVRRIIGMGISLILRLGTKTRLPRDSQCGLKIFEYTEHLNEILLEDFETRWFFEMEFYERYRKQQGEPIIVEIPLTVLGNSVSSKLGLQSVFGVLNEIWKVKKVQIKNQSTK